MRRADHPAIGLVLDSFHTLARKTDLKAMRSIPRDRIFLVQVADAPVLDMDPLSWSRHFRNFPGQGDLPLLDFMEALQATGFDGALSLEIFNDQFRAGSARSVAVDGHRSLLFLLDQLRARTGVAQAGASGAAGAIEMPRHRVHRVRHRRERRRRLRGGCCAGLGFARAGVHKSKSVTRWSQGAINIVVNTEKEGFAHSYNITHGTSVCAIGLRVDDAAATLDRAQKLLDQPFRQAVGPGELEIPAVRGLGGSLIYFIDPKSDLRPVWDVEFEPTGEDAAKSGRRPHPRRSHLAVDALRGDADLAAVLHLAARPGEDARAGRARSRRPGQEPGGAVGRRRAAHRPQRLAVAACAVVALPVGGVRLGRAAHRVCDRRHLRDRRAPARPTAWRCCRSPRTTTTTSRAKTDLSAEQIEALKAHNILYDRDGAAEYLQVYTQTFEDRFFFEIVERRGYKGFGAANAPIRLAAQARLARDVVVP